MEKKIQYPKKDKNTKNNKDKKKKNKKKPDKESKKFIEEEENIKEEKKMYSKIEKKDKDNVSESVTNITEKEINKILDNIIFDEFFENLRDESDNILDKSDHISEENDKEQDKIINKELNPYSVNGNLNNNLNPFINNKDGITEMDNIPLEKENSNEYFTDSSSSDSFLNIIDEKEEKVNNSNIDIENKDDNTGYINKDYLSEFNKICNKNNEFIGFYRNITYKGKIYYLMTKIKNINKVNILHYYCRNHDTCKSSLDGKRHSLCESKIDLNKKDNKYILITDHSDKCREFDKVILENSSITNKEIENRDKYKEELINILNSNPLIVLSNFKKLALELYRGNDFKFDLKKSFIRNLYYRWKKDNIIFTKFSVFSTNKTINGEIYMCEFLIKSIYKNNNSDKQIQHEHIIFISPFQIRKIIKTPHLYIDCTFIYPQDFCQLIVILYYDIDIQKRSPGCYILINNKTENGYKLSFKSFKNIITLEDTIQLSLISYSTDFEKALYNAIEDTFPNIRRLGCFFHYSYNIRKKLKEYNIIKKENAKDGETFLKDLLSIPFKIQNNEYIIDEIFKKYINNPDVKNFKTYFYKQWENLIKSGILNYAYASVEQRSNSFIENYNRRIKSELCKYIIYIYNFNI